MNSFKSIMDVANSQIAAAVKDKHARQSEHAMHADVNTQKTDKLTPADLKKIKLVATKFESLFLDMIFNSMSKDIEKSSFVDHGSGYKIFNSLFYDAVANSETYGNGIGIAKMIVGYFKEHPALINNMGSNEVKTSIGKLYSTNNIFQAYKRSSESDIGISSLIQQTTGENPLQSSSQNNIDRNDNKIDKNGYITADEIAEKASKIYGISYNLIKAVMKTESGFNPYAISNKGAVGLMQLMPETAKDLGVDIDNPIHNVFGGALYLKKMMERYDGDVKLALAAYNAGAENVDKYKGIPPFEETENYVKTVLNYYKEYNKISNS